jgi:isopenicillin N synthase-like dioxygenase
MMTDSRQPIIPVIDVAGLYRGGSVGLAETAATIGAACRDTGFFYVGGHHVPPALMQAVFAAAQDFFRQPASVKQEAGFDRANNRGYIRMGGEALDPSKPADLKEAFNIGLELAPGDADLLAKMPFRGANLWPDIPGFRQTMLDYFDAVLALGRDLHRAFAVDLSLDPEFFAPSFTRSLATLRLLHYPPAPASLLDGQRGAGEHTDYGNVTLLATDEVGGLEVRTRAGEWLKAPPMPGYFICNIGDCLMRWTNDVYVSTPHRVTNPAGRERYSVAFFLDANPDARVECLPTCATPDRPVRYRPISAADYLRSRLDPTYDGQK